MILSTRIKESEFRDLRNTDKKSQLTKETLTSVREGMLKCKMSIHK